MEEFCFLNNAISIDWAVRSFFSSIVSTMVNHGNPPVLRSLFSRDLCITVGPTFSALLNSGVVTWLVLANEMWVEKTRVISGKKLLEPRHGLLDHFPPSQDRQCFDRGCCQLRSWREDNREPSPKWLLKNMWVRYKPLFCCYNPLRFGV